MTRDALIGLFDVYMLIFWLVAYIECIRIGFKQKTYCMPLLAICMNFCWETLSFVDYIIYNGENIYMYVLYGAWMILDIGIITTFVCFHKEEAKCQKGSLNAKFLSARNGALVFLIVLAVILLMYFTLPSWKGYFVFPNNLVMSIQFLFLPFVRNGARGQSMSIAITKCIGTLCATMTVLLGGSYELAIMGFVCFVLDAVYIFLLKKTVTTEHAKA